MKKGQKKQTKKQPQAQAGVRVRRGKPTLRIPGLSIKPGSFGAAIRAPFSRAAEGARLPDGNPNSTVTFSVTKKLVLTSNTSGDLDVAFFPNLQIAGISSRNSLVGGTPLFLGSTVTTLNTRNAGVSSTTANGVGFDTYNLFYQYHRYRIVSFGVRLRIRTGVTTTGEFVVGTLPVKGMLPPLESYIPAVFTYDGVAANSQSYWSGVGPRNTLQGYFATLGLPYSGSDNTAVIDVNKIVNIPNHAVVSGSEAAARGVHVRGVPFEGSARDFRSMVMSQVGSDAMDVAFDIGSTDPLNRAVQTLGVDTSAWDVGGLETILITGNGFAASSEVASVEFVYHVEATPNPNYSQLARPTGVLAPVSPGQTLDSVLTHIHRVPRISFADAITAAGDAILGEVEGRASAAAGRGLASVGGMLARMIGAGL